MIDPIAVSIPDAAKMLGVSRTKIYTLIASQELSRRKAGKRALILVSDLRNYAENLPTEAG